MKVLTLHQPQATLVALLLKKIETRSWSTKYRGPLAIHAAARRPTTVRVGSYYAVHLNVGMASERWVLRTTGRNGGPDVLPARSLPLGAIVATCTLVDVVPIIPEEANPIEQYPCVQSMVGFGEFPDGWLELYHPTMGNLLDPEGSGRSMPGEAAYGDFEPGRFAWLLDDVKPVDPPVPFKGGQGLSREWNP